MTKTLGDFARHLHDMPITPDELSTATEAVHAEMRNEDGETHPFARRLFAVGRAFPDKKHAACVFSRLEAVAGFLARHQDACGPHVRKNGEDLEYSEALAELFCTTRLSDRLELPARFILNRLRHIEAE